MVSPQKFWLVALIWVLAATGCAKSRDRAQVEALNEARQQAALTGVAQRTVYTDTDGSTVIAVVEPPAPGDPEERITTTKVAAAGAK